MKMKKYELTSETKILFGRTLYRIRALISFSNITAGDLGGWIEKESNLSHKNNAWVYGNARVYGNAEVSGDAEVYGNARVYGNAEVSGDAEVSGNAWVYGNAEVYGNARVYGDAWVYGNAEVSGDAEVYGNARVYGDAEVSGDADLLWISKIGSRNDTVTFTKSKELKILVAVGCFKGTIEEFEEKVKKTHGDNEHAQAYFLAIQLAKLRIKL